MTFAELLSEAQFWAKAPHLDGALRSAIRASTLKYHRKAKFWRDLVTVQLVNLPSNYIQLINIAANLPRFRQLQSVEGCTLREANDLLTEDGYVATNIALMAGTSLNIKRDTNITSVAITYWQDPIVSPEGAYSSWIADTQPDLIICSAAAKALAFDAESEIYQAAIREEQDQWMELLANNVEGVGR